MLAFEGNASQGRSTSENRFSKRPLGGNDPPRWKVGLSPAAQPRVTIRLRRWSAIDFRSADFCCKYYGSLGKIKYNNSFERIPEKSAKMIRF